MHDQSWTVVKSQWSSTWKSVGTGLRDVVLPGLSWVLGDGKSIKFWTDKWVSDTPLLDQITAALPAGFKEVYVHELWINGAGWDFARFMEYLPDNIRLKLVAIVVDNVTGARDRLSWSGKSDGEFSVSSAYCILTRDMTPRQNWERFFTMVWKVIAPERVRAFLWLVANQAIMTNMERNRRHLCDTSLCVVCKGGEESILHVLRDCPAMMGIWLRLVPARRRTRFFSMTLWEWFYENLGNKSVVETVSWDTLFAITVWWGWKWRCGNVFGENRKCRDRVRFIKELARDVFLAHAHQEEGAKAVVRVERNIGWRWTVVWWFCAEYRLVLSSLGRALGCVLWIVHGLGTESGTS